MAHEVPADEVDKPERNTRRTLGFICAIAIIDGLDTQLLPASFRALEASLGYSPIKLSSLATAQGLAMALAGPVWATLADNGVPRKYLLGSGASMWGLWTLCLAFTFEYHHMLAFRVLNGAALAMLSPVTQSIVAEISGKGTIGRNFGVISLCDRLFGELTAIIVVTAISNQIVFGMNGWRVAFIGVACLSFLSALTVIIFMHERTRAWTPEKIGFFIELGKFREFWFMPTFRVIIFQGMLGRIPWMAIGGFGPMYFQYVGLTDLAAGVVSGMIIAGAGLGALLGGFIGDYMATWSPHHGRILTAQASILMAIPLVVLLFWAVPKNPQYQYLMGVTCFLLGLLASWCPAGCNRPIMVDISAHQGTASILAWDACLERGVASLIGPMAVGILVSTVFGYKTSELQVADMDEETRLTNCNALGNSIILCAAGPWALVFCIYSILHWTYAADLARNEKMHRHNAIDGQVASYGSTH